MKWISALFLAIFILPFAAAQSDPPPFPEWYRAHIEFMTRDGGDWIAPNADFSETNPYEFYGIQWTAMPGNSGMTGRLYGIREDGQTDDFWQFREFWHVGDNQARVMQWSMGGAYGDGVMTRYADAFSTVRQTFVWPNGARTEGGHIIRTPDESTYFAEQYRVNTETGQWEFEHALTFRRRE